MKTSERATIIVMVLLGASSFVLIPKNIISVSSKSQDNNYGAEVALVRRYFIPGLGFLGARRSILITNLLTLEEVEFLDLAVAKESSFGSPTVTWSNDSKYVEVVWPSDSQSRGMLMRCFVDK